MTRDWPATPTEIGQHFLEIPWMDARLMNWGCVTQDKRHMWDVNTETYINGVALWIDQDYLNAFLLQAVDRTTELLTYVLVVSYPGMGGGRDFVWYPEPCGTLGNPLPAASSTVVGKWAVETAYELFDEYMARDLTA